jgi:hypothetical protein
MRWSMLSNLVCKYTHFASQKWFWFDGLTTGNVVHDAEHNLNPNLYGLFFVLIVELELCGGYHCC